jgi:hypothetical protein
MEAGNSPASLLQPPVHLIVLQHGLWGNTTCVSNLEKYLRQHLVPKGPHQHSTTDTEAGATDHAAAGPAAAAAAANDPAGHHEAEVQILNSDVNRKALTYDGEGHRNCCDHSVPIHAPPCSMHSRVAGCRVRTCATDWTLSANAPADHHTSRQSCTISHSLTRQACTTSSCLG